MPNVIGISDAAAKVKLNRAGLEIDIAQVISDHPKGTVISQNPTFGSRVEEGSTVSVSVSAGPGQKQIPNVEGLPRATRARPSTRWASASASTASEHGVRQGPGDPHRARRRQPARGGLVVDLYISSGPPAVEVPDVTGRPLDEARGTLEDAGFKVSTIDKETADADPGTVLSQDPPSGEAPEGSTVTADGREGAVEHRGARRPRRGGLGRHHHPPGGRVQGRDGEGGRRGLQGRRHRPAPGSAARAQGQARRHGDDRRRPLQPRPEPRARRHVDDARTATTTTPGAR